MGTGLFATNEVHHLRQKTTRVSLSIVYLDTSPPAHVLTDTFYIDILKVKHLGSSCQYRFLAEDCLVQVL